MRAVPRVCFCIACSLGSVVSHPCRVSHCLVCSLRGVCVTRHRLSGGVFCSARCSCGSPRFACLRTRIQLCNCLVSMQPHARAWHASVCTCRGCVTRGHAHINTLIITGYKQSSVPHTHASGCSRPRAEGGKTGVPLQSLMQFTTIARRHMKIQLKSMSAGGGEAGQTQGQPTCRVHGQAICRLAAVDRKGGRRANEERKSRQVLTAASDL